MQKDKSAKKNDKKNEEGKGQFAEESKSGRYFVP
jgi:histone H3/H4